MFGTEKSAFVVVLEEEEYDYSCDDPTQLDRFGRAMLHGKGYDRWYDKSFNVIVMKNGRVSHSVLSAVTTLVQALLSLVSPLLFFPTICLIQEYRFDGVYGYKESIFILVA